MLLWIVFFFRLANGDDHGEVFGNGYAFVVVHGHDAVYGVFARVGREAQTWDQLALMVKASPEGAGLEFDVIKRLLMLTIDVVVHMKAHAGKRYITGIDFDPATRLKWNQPT